MATNPYISKKVRSEQSLYEDLVIESLKFYGEDVYYIPREIVNKDKIFADDVPSRFTDAYKIETYIENTEGFDGEGDLFTKFGIELRDQATFVFARRRWKKLIGDNLAEVGFRPREGDVIYLPMSNSMFEVMKVETETPFYQLSQLPVFRMQCELFEYSDEDFDTNIASIDAIEYEGAYQYKVTMEPTTNIDASIEATGIRQFTGKISSVNLTNGGLGYNTAPTVTVSSPTGFSKFGQSSLNVPSLKGFAKNYLYTSENGTVEMFVYPNILPSNGTQQALFHTGGDSSLDPDQIVLGLNDQGKLKYSFRNNFGGSSSNVIDNSPISAQSWSHILFGFDSNGSGLMSRLYVYVNGNLAVDSDLGRELNIIGQNPLSLGTEAPHNYNGVFYDTFNGYVDETRALSGNKSTIFDPRTTEVSVDSAGLYAVEILSGDGQDYTFSATSEDANGILTDLTDPAITLKVNDTISFLNNSGGHPLQILDSAYNQIAYQQENNQTILIPTVAGTYYYQCTVGGHENMIGTITVEDINTNDELIVPTSSFDSDANTALLDHLDGRTAVLTTNITDGVVTSVNIVDSGLHYNETPTITVESNLNPTNYLIGETVTQTNPNYTIKGEVTRWSDSDRILQLAHVGTTNGTFNTFSTSKSVVGASSSAEWLPRLVEDMQEIQPTAQNKVFDDFEADFLDFSESNPFGDMF